MRQLLRVIRRSFWLQLRLHISNPFVLYLALFYPVIMAAVLAFMMHAASTSASSLDIAVRSGLLGMWGTTLAYGSDSVGEEREAGTLELIVGAPSSLLAVFGGKLLGAIFISLTSMVISFGIAASIIGNLTGPQSPSFFFIALMLSVAGFTTLGLVIASAFFLSPAVQHLTNGFEYLGYILGGIVFPVESLPLWTRPASYIFAAYWASNGLNASIHAPTFASFVSTSAALIVLILLYLLIAYWSFRVIVRLAQNEGALALQ